jgi:hypothetical protein
MRLRRVFRAISWEREAARHDQSDVLLLEHQHRGSIKEKERESRFSNLMYFNEDARKNIIACS